MSLVLLCLCLDLALLAALALTRRRRPSTHALEEAFASAAANARNLAHDVLIIDAAISEWAELVVEESLTEMGMQWMAEPT